MLDICLPVYDRMEPKTVASLLTARMPGKGITFCIVEDEPDIVTVRNKLSHQVKNDLSLWVDSDIVFPPDAILKMARVMEKHSDAGIVTGLYRGRSYPNEVTIFKWAILGGEQGMVSAFNKNIVDGSEDFEIDACGAGMMLVRNQLFKDGCTFDKLGKYSEDLSFCMRARDLGYKIYACPSVRCLHVAKTVLEV